MIDTVFAVLIYVAAWALLYVLSRMLDWEKKGITVAPFFLMLKTSYLNQRLGFISAKRERIWRIIWNLGIVLAFGQMFFIIYFLTHNLVDLAYRTPQAASMVLLLPGVTVSLETLPYVILALAVVLLTHEFAHAIASLTDSVPIKSAGLFLAFIVPGGFVELDEEQVERASLLTKLRIFSAGSSTNIAAWLVVSLLIVNFTMSISPLYQGPSGILVSGVIDNGGASEAGMKKWDVIYAINDQPVRNADELGKMMSEIQPGKALSLKTDRGTISVLTKPHPQDPKRALLGIYPFNYYAPNLSILPKELPYHLYWSEYWTSSLLVWVAIFNTLPLYPLDGDKIIYSLVSARSKAAAKLVRISASGIFLVIVGLNLLISFLNFGLTRI